MLFLMSEVPLYLGPAREARRHARQTCHARVLEEVAKSKSPLKVVVFKSQQPCPDTVSLDLNLLLHSGVVRSHRGEYFLEYDFSTKITANEKLLVTFQIKCVVLFVARWGGLGSDLAHVGVERSGHAR